MQSQRFYPVYYPALTILNERDFVIALASFGLNSLR